MTNLTRRAAFCLAGGALIASGVRARATIRMISLGFTSGSGGPQQIGTDCLQREISARTNGQLVVDERGGVTLGSENAVVAATQAGALDICVVSGPVVGPVVPQFGIFDVPFLFRDTAHVKAVADGPIGEAIAANFKDKNLVLLAIGEQGFRNVTNSRHPVRTPADLKGLKIRVLPNDIYKMTFRALGAEVVPMQLPLMYSALKDGRIDGQENPLPTIAASRLQDVQKYLSVTGHIYAPVAFLMNRRKFLALDPAMQTAVIDAARAAAEATRRAGVEANARSLQTLTQAGMEVITNVDREPFMQAVQTLEPEFEKRFGKELLASIRGAH